MAISSHRRRAARAPAVHDLAHFARRLESATGRSVPLLVVRIRELQRIAWREGRAAARRAERNCLGAFVATASSLLRSDDALGHERDSEDFLVALLAATRRPGMAPSPIDCRAALQRFAAALAAGSGCAIESGWILIGEGISESGARRALCEAVERALEHGARERERYAFFSTVGHELRTPLSSVRGYVETLLSEELEPATVRRYLETVRTETLRMSRLVDGMFDVSLLDMRAAPARLERTALAPALRATADTIAPAARRRSCTVTIEPCESLEVALGSDALSRILVNVLDNAVKHGREGGRVAVQAVVRDRRVEVFVDDDGPGVPLEQRERIFELGRRGAGVRAQGSGLGLAVVRLLLERSGGDVDVTAGPLGGARFRLRLPRAADAPGVSRGSER